MTPKKLLLIAWDSADWSIINPLLDRGDLPALATLIDQGIMGKLRALHPLTPIINWTTLATGNTPDKHGVLLPGQPNRAKSLWQITSEAGLSTHAIGWPGTSPAVSKALRLNPSEIPAQALLEFIPRAREIDQRYDDRLARVAAGLSVCCSIHNAATWALEHQPWQFAAIHYSAIGAFSETFMPYRAPRLRTIGETEFEIYRDVVDGIYRFHDHLLARLLELAGEETAIVLVSANGFESGARRPERTSTGFKKTSTWLTDQGILCLRGPGIRKDELVHGASILDIAPTILSLLGLPVAGDMDGKVILDAFENPPLPSHSVIENSVAARGLAEQFISLGTAQETADENLRFNLVSVYMSTGRPQHALPILEHLFDDAPEDLRYQRALAQCYVAVSRLDDAEQLLATFLAGHETHPWMDFLMGVIHMHREQLDPALQSFQKAEKSPALYTFIGNVYLAKKLWNRAEKSFAEALALDPSHAAAQTGMSAIRLRQRREEEAAAHALEAVSLRYDQPAAHYQLGVAMARMGHRDRATTALKAALALAPEMKPARRLLKRVAEP